MVINPPGAIGTPDRRLAEFTTPGPVTVGEAAAGAGALTTAFKAGDCPAWTVPPGPTAKAVTIIDTVPGLNGRQLPCQIPFPMWTICTVSVLEKLAFTLALCPP